MPVSNRYPKPNPGPRDFRPPGSDRRHLKPFRPTRPFQWSPPIKEPGKFPGVPRPGVPFGKRMPIPPGVLQPVMAGVAYRWAVMALRLYPWLALGLTLWELWQLYKAWNPPPGGNFCARSDGTPDYWYWSPHQHCYADATSTAKDPRFKEWSVGAPVLRHSNEVPRLNYLVRPLEWYGPYDFAPPDIPPLPEVGAPLPVTIPYLPPTLPWPVLPWEPIAVPPLSPQPLPIPRPPWVPQLPNPEAEPGPDPWFPDVPPEYEPGVRPNPRPVPGTRPWPVYPPYHPDAGFWPPGQEATDPSGRPGPGSRPRPQPLPEPSPARPPGRRVKERKLSASSRQRKLLGMLASGASEGFDLLDALFDALPDSIKRRFKDHPNEKFKALYRHWDKVDMNKAFENIWRNQVEDRYFGQKFGEMQDALSEAGLDFPSLRDIGGNFTGLR